MAESSQSFPANGEAPSNADLNNEPTGIVPTKAAAKSSAQAQQMRKLREANEKYKNLLKMAKERIQQQEEEMEQLRQELHDAKEHMEREQKEAAVAITMDDADGGEGENSSSIVSVLQRVKALVDGNGGYTTNENLFEEIWALIEFEEYNEESGASPKYFRKWKRFDTEAELSDFIRRDTGEPLTLPPYSLAPEQSARIQEGARQEVSQVTEEFRRFRVRAELARKQADAHIKELQNSNVQTAQRRIEGHDLDQQWEQVRSERGQLDRLKAEMAEQEAQWKEAYDVLLAENNALKSSGSEALLAAQWRQRYETCLTEKENLESQLQTALQKQEQEKEERKKADTERYEIKYRDLKESFRLYRKKAKEIFEAQQNGEVTSQQFLNLNERGSEESKLSYLKNLMVNYLSSDPEVRDHMEKAIGTVLQFSPENIEKIEKKKNESWLFSIT